MRWKKLGLVFAPDKNHDWMVSHAAVPFADHVEGDLYSVYFSTRDSKNRSYTGYITIDLKEPQRVLEISAEPVLSPGEIGTFDDSGTMLSWITRVNDTRYLYYIGWNLGVTVPFRNSIGLAIGNKDQRFEKRHGPIVDRGFFDPCFVASSCVIFESGLWRMWYLSCIKWAIVEGKPRHWYHLKYAESADGINWVRNGAVCIDFKSPDEYAISRPSVLKENGVYKMWFSYRGSSYRIGYAESVDGIVWTRKDEEAGIDISASGWDSEMIEYPFVFVHKGNRYMLYNGNGYGKTGFGIAVQQE